MVNGNFHLLPDKERVIYISDSPFREHYTSEKYILGGAPLLMNVAEGGGVACFFDGKGHYVERIHVSETDVRDIGLLRDQIGMEDPLVSRAMEKWLEDYRTSIVFTLPSEFDAFIEEMRGIDDELLRNVGPDSYVSEFLRRAEETFTELSNPKDFQFVKKETNRRGYGMPSALINGKALNKYNVLVLAYEGSDNTFCVEGSLHIADNVETPPEWVMVDDGKVKARAAVNVTNTDKDPSTQEIKGVRILHYPDGANALNAFSDAVIQAA
jgi:hypothetical protein